MKWRLVWLGLAAVALVGAWALHRQVPWAVNALLPAGGWFALKGLT